MREVDLQRWVIDVVRQHGGFGYKLSHAYSVGICDLLTKLPDTRISSHGAPRFNPPAMLLEVKQKYGTRDGRAAFTLDVTTPQQNFLRNFQQAGMRVGVLSFLQQGKIRLSARMFELDALQAARYVVKPSEHEWLGKRPEQQSEMMYAQLLEFAK